MFKSILNNIKALHWNTSVQAAVVLAITSGSLVYLGCGSNSTASISDGQIESMSSSDAGIEFVETDQGLDTVSPDGRVEQTEGNVDSDECTDGVDDHAACGANTKCTNTVGSFTCECLPEFGGDPSYGNGCTLANLVTNGTFSKDYSGWTDEALTSTAGISPGSIVWMSDDSANDEASGSVAVVCPASSTTTHRARSLSQCIPVTAGQSYRLQAMFYGDLMTVHSMSIYFFSSETCDGSTLDSFSESWSESGSDSWTVFGGAGTDLDEIAAPEGATHAKIVLGSATYDVEDGPAVSLWDNIVLKPR